MKKVDIKTPEQIRATTGKNQIHFSEENLNISYRTYQYRLAGLQDWRFADLRKLCEMDCGSVIIPKSKGDGKAYKISISEL